MEENINKGKMNLKKIILQIFIVLFSLLMLIILLITIVSTVKSAGNLAFGKYKFYIMKSDYEINIAGEGDLVVVKEVNADEIKVGDNIVYSNNNFYYLNNVLQTPKFNTIKNIIVVEDDGIRYKYDISEIEGKVICNINNIGNIITCLRTPVGIIFFILFIICLFTLSRVIFIHNKKG